MPLSHAEAVLSLRDDPTLATMSDTDARAEAEALLGDDDPLAIALVVEEARRLGPAPPPAQPAATAEGCRLEKSCGGANPVAANGRCMVCGANRGTAEEPEPSNTEAPQPPPTPADAPRVTELPDGGKVTLTPATFSTEPLTARAKAALGATDAEIAKLIGVSRPTAQAYASGRLPEIIDGVRAEYLRRAARKRRVALDALERELTAIIVASD